VSVDVDQVVEVSARLALIVGLMIVGLAIVRLVRNQVLRRLSATEKMDEARKKQLQTVLQVLIWAANVTIVGIAVVMSLGLFVDIGPLIAGIGVVGLALSLGAQTLIKDLIGGLVILIENQYAVGDVIAVGDVSGVVERLTLRATYVRGLDGKLHLMPNGDVRTVSNVTRGWSRAVVDLGVAYEEDMERVLATLKREAEAFAEVPDYVPLLLEPPAVLGPLTLGDWAVTVRVMVKTLPGKQWSVAMELRKRLLAACDRENISLPYPRQEVIVRRTDPPVPTGGLSG
jgi:small conductance mechanosensitive channel